MVVKIFCDVCGEELEAPSNPDYSITILLDESVEREIELCELHMTEFFEKIDEFLETSRKTSEKRLEK